MSEPELLEVGRIGKAHGVRGEVAVHLSTNRLERVEVGAQLVADGRRLTIERARPHQDKFIVAFAGVADRSQAEALRGLVVRAKGLTDDDELWIHELIGATVVEADGTDRGAVASVEANPASDLLVLDSGALVPLTFLLHFADGVVTVDVPDGLFEATAPQQLDETDEPPVAGH